MQLQLDANEHAANTRGLYQETDGLARLHQTWTQHVAAWRLAHEAAAANAEDVLARMDALIAKLEAR
ncbi:MAG: hypothetical protein GC190_09660 [Alphaproteobacteria bacterium]|nr:hypothetical protein [Alphaproteobacteria bacterium]